MVLEHLHAAIEGIHNEDPIVVFDKQSCRQLEPAEQQCLRRVHSTGRPQALRQGAWAVQGWPVHGADWKREILRSVRDAD